MKKSLELTKGCRFGLCGKSSCVKSWVDEKVERWEKSESVGEQE